jgi:hypothetical protein
MTKIRSARKFQCDGEITQHVKVQKGMLSNVSLRRDSQWAAVREDVCGAFVKVRSSG